MEIPPLTPHWFHAIDAPIKDPIATRIAKRDKSLLKKPLPTTPKNWVPFSKRDNQALETAYQNKISTVAVNEDYLFEVNIAKREIYPIYWEGPTYQVRRATWFMQGDGASKWLPCEENMAAQIEEGYRNHQPYIEKSIKEEKDIDLGDKVNYKVEEKDSQTVNVTIESSIKEEEKEFLKEPYVGQYIVYTSQTKAWLLYDTTSANITKSLLTKLTNNQNLGGTRLIRGYAEVKKDTTEKKKTPTNEKQPKKQHERASMDSVDLTQPQTTKEREAEMTEHQENDYENEESEEIHREIDQLVFVIHGIGQQMTERVTGQNLVHDVNMLRKTIKSIWPVSVAGPNPIKQSNGIQVLPILWRKSILVGAESDNDEQKKLESDIGINHSDDGCPSLEEITLEGAPNIRNLVADVFLDIPLYMTSKHHEKMIRVITKEINRVYKLFIERHPYFLKNNGQVSLFAHSLGSLLAFDILAAQPFPQTPTLDPKKPIALDFHVKNYFGLGSPLGMLLLLRGEKIKSRKNTEKPEESSHDDVTFVYPAVDNIYNIFHKSDPVAYRLEPLVVRHYGAQLKPEPIPYVKGGLKSMLDAGFNVGTDIANRASNMFESIKTGITSTLLMRGLGFSKPLDAAASSYTSDDIEIKKRSATDPDIMASRLAAKSAATLKLFNPSGRLDYYIQEGLLENTYISALSVHMSYWQDVDVASFLIRELYKESKESTKVVTV